MNNKQSYFKNFFAGILLIVLLIIHSVKLLHSHSYLPVCINQNAENSNQKIPVAEKVTVLPGKCVVCTYHLNKDSDTVTTFQQSVLYSYNENKSSPVFTSPCITFSFIIETRGPPALV